MIFQFKKIKTQNLNYKEKTMEDIYKDILKILGFIITACISIYTIKKQIYANNVSNSRNNWLIDLREELGEVVKVLKYINACQNKQQIIKHCPIKFMEDRKIRMEGEKARTIIASKLNISTIFGNEYNKYLLDKLNQIDFMSDGPFDVKFITSIELLTKKILESEWTKVKREAQGKPSSKEEYKSYINKWVYFICFMLLIGFTTLGYYIVDTVDETIIVVSFITLFVVILLLIFFLLRHAIFCNFEKKLDMISKEKQEEAKNIAEC